MLKIAFSGLFYAACISHFFLSFQKSGSLVPIVKQPAASAMHWQMELFRMWKHNEAKALLKLYFKWRIFSQPGKKRTGKNTKSLFLLLQVHLEYMF